MATQVRKRGNYIAATADELRHGTVAAGTALFRRRGTIELHADALVLTAWHDGGDLLLPRAAILAVRREFTPLYGRLAGGLLDGAKPLILQTTDAGEIYLLIDRREVSDLTRDRQWESTLLRWLRT